MKTFFKIPVLVVLLVLAAAIPCRAEMGIMFVTKEKAKELGLQLTITPNGSNNAVVVLEFKTNGTFANFSHVSLEIRDNQKFLLGYNSLQSKPTDSGSVKAGLTANRAFLENVTLRVVVKAPLGDTGYDLRVKDFMELPTSAPPK